MKQRVALAIALLADPPVLVLDEMTSNLDAASREGLLDLLARQRERGKTILFTSHRLDEVQTLADRVLVLEAGRAVADCAPGRLAEVLGLGVRLRILLDPADHERAEGVLREGGFDARVNGCGGVKVSVRPDRKAEVLRRLESAGIRVSDFELETASAPEAAPAKEVD
jgi:ABC-type multidrug transport system ATPase subunit